VNYFLSSAFDKGSIIIGLTVELDSDGDAGKTAPISDVGTIGCVGCPL
jgi:hypothetical protein